MSLLQKAKSLTKIAEKNVRKTNCGHDELVFLARVINEGRRRLLQMWLGLNNRRRVLKLGFFYLLLILWYYCLSYSQRNITVPRSAHSCRRFRQDSFNLSFSLKTWLTVRNRTACFPTRYTRFQIRKTACRSGLCTSRKYDFRTFEARGTQIFSIFLPFCPKRSKQVVWAWQKQETCRTLGKN